jgi:hypothetical protein
MSPLRTLQILHFYHRMYTQSLIKKNKTTPEYRQVQTTLNSAHKEVSHTYSGIPQSLGTLIFT